jgi:5-methylcytosine-specific restriction endonuclease McrA
MFITNAAISKMTFDELRKVKLFVSKEQNKFSPEYDRWIKAETLRKFVESREDELEKQYIQDAKTRGARFRRCSCCETDKPLEDHPYGFMFTIGKVVTVCKRCQRNKSKKHHANNLEAGRARAEYHQNKRQLLGSIDNADRALVRNLQKDKCAYCGEELHGGGEFDHYIPVEYGGSNMIANRVLACTTCNRNKGRKMPDMFLRWRKIHKLPIRLGGFYEPIKQGCVAG